MKIDRNALEEACAAYCDPKIPNNLSWDEAQEERIVLFNATAKYQVRLSMTRAINAYLKSTSGSEQ